MVIDETFLQFTGGISNSCLNNILSFGNTIDENNELPIIRRSSYYDFDKFNSLAQTNGEQFSILSSNIQSINAKFSELEAFVNIYILTTHLYYYYNFFLVKYSYIKLTELMISHHFQITNALEDIYR